MFRGYVEWKVYRCCTRYNGRIDELLCFINNKLQILQCEELIHVCTNVFTDVNIKDSKLKFLNAINRGP